MIRRYYEEEMRYLHEAGREFARLHPEQAGLLDLDSVTDRDPYVERLFEGFAFLTGRVRERLDDELPEYTESLFRLLHPAFLKPFPSATILSFEPRPGMVQTTTTLAAGTEVRSGSVGDEGTVCRFTTAYTVTLQPIRLRDVRLAWPSRDTSTVTLRFQVDHGTDFSKLDLRRLRLHFHAEAATADAMRRFFWRHVAQVTVRAGETAVTIPGAEAVQPVGLTPEEGLLPDSDPFVGHRLLEYFCFRAKYDFVDLLGLDRLVPSPGEVFFEVEILFDGVFPEEHAFTAEHLRLYCTPAVNVFEQDVEPIRVDHRSAEYRVVGDVNRRQGVRVYDVRAVESIEDRTGRRHNYAPFFDFGFDADGGRFYHEHSVTGPDGCREVALVVAGFGDDVDDLPVETLSITARCTNGTLPHEALDEGAICKPGPGLPNVAAFKNLTRPTRELDPPLAADGQLYWKLLSHLAFNRMSVATPDALAGVLALYEWTGSEANRRRIDGLRDVAWAPKTRLHRGSVLRGSEIRLTVQEDHFSDAGDLLLFGEVLSAFLSGYATLNSFVHLTITAAPGGKEYRWQPTKGTQPLA